MFIIISKCELKTEKKKLEEFKFRFFFSALKVNVVYNYCEIQTDKNSNIFQEKYFNCVMHVFDLSFL